MIGADDIDRAVEAVDERVQERLEELVELLVPAIAAELAARMPRAARDELVDVKEVARYLGVTRGWVYEHADELRARRLGTGQKPVLQFSLADVDDALTCHAVRESSVREASGGAGSRSRRRRRSGTGVELLPVRGRS